MQAREQFEEAGGLDVLEQLQTHESEEARGSAVACMQISIVRCLHRSMRPPFAS
jgi:hypothetical protein